MLYSINSRYSKKVIHETNDLAYARFLIGNTNMYIQYSPEAIKQIEENIK